VVAVVLGGIATTWGPVLGAAFIVVITQVSATYQSLEVIIYAGLVIAIVLVEPAGLLSLLTRLWRLITRRGGQPLKVAPPSPVKYLETLPVSALPSSSEVLLQAQGLKRSFGAVKAVDGVTFEIKRGEIIGIIGPNGSGKTTLMNLLAGELLPDSGKLTYRQASLGRTRASARARLGIAKAAQVVQPFRRMSLLDNVALGATYGSQVGRVSLRASREIAASVLRSVGFVGDLDSAAEGLPLQFLKRLELARVLVTRPSLALLDEVFAGVEPQTGEQLLLAVADLQAAGLSVILVEHRIDLLFRIAPRILVMDQGRIIADAAPSEILKDARVVEAYFGSRYVSRLSARLAPES
jgi:ABC-type branched-subunit amino acid transport system ATPase component